MQLLIAGGTDPMQSNEYGESPLTYAVKSGNAELVGTLLVGGAFAQLSPERQFAFFQMAADDGNATLLKTLLLAGSAANTSLDGKPSLAETAILSARPRVLEALLAAGAEANQVSFTGGASLLALAVEHGARDMVDILLKYGATLSVQDERQSPLEIGLRKGRSDIVEQLLLHGADPDQRFSDGFTALTLAVTLGNISSVKLLLQADAKVSEPAADGRSASDIAASAHYLIIAKLLAQHLERVGS
jgi:ankyrin repeat protein